MSDTIEDVKTDPRPEVEIISKIIGGLGIPLISDWAGNFSVADVEKNEWIDWGGCFNEKQS